MLRKEKRGLASIQDSVDASIQRLEDYIPKRRRGLITATRNSTNNTRTNRTEITRKQHSEEKQLYGRFKWLTSDTSYMKTWTWLRKGNLKRETEAQNNAIRTNNIKARIDKTQQKGRCRLCGNRNETNRIISECIKLAQKEYKTRHDRVGQMIHWKLCKKFELTIKTNCICIAQNLSWRMRCTNFSGILRYKRITESQPDEQTL